MFFMKIFSALMFSLVVQASHQDSDTNDKLVQIIPSEAVKLVEKAAELDRALKDAAQARELLQTGKNPYPRDAHDGGLARHARMAIAHLVTQCFGRAALSFVYPHVKQILSKEGSHTFWASNFASDQNNIESWKDLKFIVGQKAFTSHILPKIAAFKKLFEDLITRLEDYEVWYWKEYKRTGNWYDQKTGRHNFPKPLSVNDDDMSALFILIEAVRAELKEIELIKAQFQIVESPSFCNWYRLLDPEAVQGMEYKIAAWKKEWLLAGVTY